MEGCFRAESVSGEDVFGPGNLVQSASCGVGGRALTIEENYRSLDSDVGMAVMKVRRALPSWPEVWKYNNKNNI